MSGNQPFRRIAIVGDGLPAALAAAYLAKACGPAGTEVVVISASETGQTGDVVARPDMLRFNAELGIDPATLCQQGVASPLFAVEMHGGAGLILLPFAPAGIANNGVDFHHYWLRATQNGLANQLADYSLPLAFHEAKRGLAFESAASFKMPFGLRLDRAAYAQSLVNAAMGFGVRGTDGAFDGILASDSAEWPLRIKIADSEIGADFVVDVTSDGAAATALGRQQSGWTNRCLWVAGDCDIPGIELFRLQRAVSRFASLVPTHESVAADSAEFNRIYFAEEQRITDMACLIEGDEVAMRARPALARKIDVFSACGRIPSEDYEVFQPCEWLAALMAQGYLPKRPERLAERLPEAELHTWLGNLRTQVVELQEQIEAAA